MQKKILLLFSLICLLISCSKDAHKEMIALQFDLYYQGKLYDCSKSEEYAFKIIDFRFYIFQTENDIHLVDFAFDDKCQATVMVPNFKIQNVEQNNFSLNLGVPNHLNHQNPVKASPPLNLSEMHWQWLSGYKFLRLEYYKAEVLNRFHLGSWGCSGKIPDSVNCEQPNVIALNFKEFVLNQSSIQIHIDGLMDIDSDSLCMGDPNVAACRKWLDALQTDVFRIKK